MCWSPESPLNVPWRSRTLGPLGDLQGTSPGRRVLAGKAAEDGPSALYEVPAVNTPSDLKFNITDCKLYVPVVTLQRYENKLYEELKTGITIDFTWSKYRTQFINQTATNNLKYLIDPTFNNVNKLSVLAFPNEEDRKSFSKYYTPTIEIKKKLIKQLLK